MQWLIIGLSALAASLAACVIVARPREGWKAATQAPAEGRITLSTCEYLVALALAEESFALDCPDDIRFFEKSVEAMLRQQRKAAGS